MYFRNLFYWFQLTRTRFNFLAYWSNFAMISSLHLFPVSWWTLLTLWFTSVPLFMSVKYKFLASVPSSKVSKSTLWTIVRLTPWFGYRKEIPLALWGSFGMGLSFRCLNKNRTGWLTFSRCFGHYFLIYCYCSCRTKEHELVFQFRDPSVSISIPDLSTMVILQLSTYQRFSIVCSCLSMSMAWYWNFFRWIHSSIILNLYFRAL